MPTLLPALCATLFVLAACARRPEPAPAAPRPPALAEIPESETRSLMALLAPHLVEIDTILAGGLPLEPGERQALWEHLDAMTRLLDDLPEGHLDPYHPQFGWRLGTLRRDLALARTAVGAEPPEYYLVGTITGSCTYCHERRR